MPGCEGRHTEGYENVNMDPRWESFEAFLADVGERPSAKYSLDRYPNGSGNYEFGNVRWATSRQQAQNRCNNVWLEHDGKRMVAADWARELGMHEGTISTRIRRGMTVAEALSKSFFRRRGESVTGHKLTEDDVRAIRLAVGRQADIAARFGVNRCVVSEIRSRKLWAHVE